MRRNLVVLGLLAVAAYAAAYIDPELVKENLRKGRETAAVEMVVEVASVSRRKEAGAPDLPRYCASAKVKSVKLNEKYASISGKKSVRRKGETVSFRLDCYAPGMLPAPGSVFMGECSEVKPGVLIKAWSRNADFPSRSGGDCQGADLGMEFYSTGGSSISEKGAVPRAAGKGGDNAVQDQQGAAGGSEGESPRKGADHLP